MTLKALLSPRTGVAKLLAALPPVTIADAAGAPLHGPQTGSGAPVPVMFEGKQQGSVFGSPGVAALLEYLLAKEAERRALAAEVLHLYREVHLIEQLSEQLATLLDLTQVGQAALDQARRLIVAASGVVLLRESAADPPRVVASFGEPAGGWTPEIQTAEITAGRVAAPLKATHRVVGMIALDRPESAPYTAADLKLLNTIALQTAIAIEGAMLAVDMVEAARDRVQLSALQKELDTARTIQHSLVPRVFPPFPERRDFDIHARMTPANAVGGDFYDFFLIDSDRLGVVIGDVSGKGIPAALYMAVTRTQIKTTALQGLSPAGCLLEVNRVLVRDRVSSMFATCFYGILDTRTGSFQYCNAGHNPPYLVRRNGTVELVPMTGGMPLGMFARLKCTEGSVTVGDRETVFLYTDGVPEATNAELADFTDARLRDSLQGTSELTCREIVDHLHAEVLGFTQYAPQSDDITMLALRRTA